jgi:hypothetical protein
MRPGLLDGAQFLNEHHLDQKEGSTGLLIDDINETTYADT